MWKWLALAWTFAAFAAHAETLDVGGRVVPFSLPDQWGAIHEIDETTRGIVFASEMDGGDVVRDALAEVGGTLLDEAGAVYVANVSGMPTLIRRMFALPKMRKRDYSVVLDTEGDVTQDFPGLAGHATLIRLDALEVVEISNYQTMEELQSALRALAPTPADE